MAKKQNNFNQYYFSKRLKEKLAKIPANFLTVVKAPSGFGKTTAVREYFAQTFSGTVNDKWYTCLGESPAKAWNGICSLFSGKNDSITEDLLELGTPTPETLPDIVALLNGFDCDEQTYCIIDNYQLFDPTIQKKMITALSACKNDNLHIIIITQPLISKTETTYQSSLYHEIGMHDFFFDNACIVHYCRLAGIKITNDDIEQIQNTSNGWIAAIRLQLQNYQETGMFVDAKAIGTLVETAVWHKLSVTERNFLLGIALLDGFTARQAAIMSASRNPDTVPAIIAKLLSLDFFIRYIADKQVYSMHAILRDYLLERFAMQPDDFIDVTHRKAAAACIAVNDYFTAAQFFIKVRDYDAILALPFTSQYFYNNKESNLIGFFECLADNCPQETLQKYPMMLLLIAYLFFRNGVYPYFFKLVEIVRHRLDNPQGLTTAERARTRAELAILLSFPQFNDISKMSTYQREAYNCLKTITNTPRSSLFYGTMPWSLGVPSVMALYWSKSGRLAELLDDMDNCLPIYSELAQGHGAGSEIVFRAEAELAQGHDAIAESLCHKALYRAREAGQPGVCLCAKLVLAEIAILRGDASAYRAACDNISNTVDKAQQRTVFRMGELSLAMLNMELGIIDDLPDWLTTIEGIRKILYAPALPYGFIFYGHLLLHKQRYAELYGLTDHALELAQKLNFILPQVYQMLYLAVAKNRDGHADEAIAHLKDALLMAMPDKVYLPFAKFLPELKPILKDLAKEPEFRDAAKLLSFAKRYAKGLQVVGNAIQKDKTLLTPREREIAVLARERLSAGEIAANLFISVNTVNTILKNVYRKLGINSKTALKDKNF